jgi:penicillin G amidase
MKLGAPVTIRRDEYGIPHIQAAGEADAWYAMGYACAQDRLWQMEWYRLRGQGLWAAVAGSVGVQDDVLFRRLDLGAAARAEAREMSAATAAMFEAYAAGVNAFVAAAALLPPEYRLTGIRPQAWEPWHSVLLFKVRHAVMGKLGLKLARTELLRRLGPGGYARFEGVQPRQALILPPGDTSPGPAAPDAALLARCAAALAGPGAAGALCDGSNSWAVHGSRTTTGGPVLCNDSHRPLDVPDVYWQCAATWPGVSLAGGAFPGFPAFPHFGFNGRVGWNITHTMADTQDLYLEIFHPSRPNLYLTEGGWAAAEVEQQEIVVKGGAPVPCRVVHTRNGTVIEGDERTGQAITLRSIAIDRVSYQWDCLRRIIAASTVGELFDAQQGWVDPVNNVVAADTTGTIGYFTRGRLPVRASAHGRRFVVPGWTGEHRWVGDVPFLAMPRVLNPREGFVLTANQRVLAGELPYIAHEFAPAGRAARIHELLASEAEATPASIAAHQADTVSVRARGWARLLAETAPLAGEAERARRLLAAWDGDLRPASGAALLYACFRQELAREVFEPIVGADAWSWIAAGANAGAESLLEGRLYDLGDGAEPDAVARALPAALAAAWRRASAAAGSSDPAAWRWAVVHSCAPRHPLSAVYPTAAAELDPPAFGLGGDNDTIRVASFSLVSQEFGVRDISVYRQVIDFAAGAMLWSIPGGASGVPGSPHIGDQLEAWRACTLVPAALSVAAAAAAARETFVLEVL